MIGDGDPTTSSGLKGLFWIFVAICIGWTLFTIILANSTPGG